MTAQLVSSPGKLLLGGVICKADGTIKTNIDLTSRVPNKLHRRFPFPCVLSHNAAVRNAMCDAVVDLFDIGTANNRPEILIYTTGLLTLLATVEIGNSAPSFSDASSGVSDGLNLPWSDVSAGDTGLASEFLMTDRDANVILTGKVGLSGEELNFPQLEIAVNDFVKILSCSYTAAP